MCIVIRKKITVEYYDALMCVITERFCRCVGLQAKQLVWVSYCTSYIVNVCGLYSIWNKLQRRLAQNNQHSIYQHLVRAVEVISRF